MRTFIATLRTAVGSGADARARARGAGALVTAAGCQTLQRCQPGWPLKSCRRCTSILVEKRKYVYTEG